MKIPHLAAFFQSSASNCDNSFPAFWDQGPVADSFLQGQQVTAVFQWNSLIQIFPVDFPMGSDLAAVAGLQR